MLVALRCYSLIVNEVAFGLCSKKDIDLIANTRLSISYIAEHIRKGATPPQPEICLVVRCALESAGRHIVPLSPAILSRLEPRRAIEGRRTKGQPLREFRVGWFGGLVSENEKIQKGKLTH